MKNFKFLQESCKFLSGAFFVTAGASWYFSWYHIAVPFIGTQMSSDFLFFRGFIHFGLFILTFYFGFVKKIKVDNSINN
jgi:hypothetical protein